ncbi:hypothetical protein [Clostridium magnum]|uniref:Uncharacterized protein n=1 Tax=Clostridium magnum DSM 2767 TaxID=1121326 RepID=A0A168E161_9CLOT|nr:hypothetical protein [Clostridium magnum]KZL93543.1 hypothetical protein CLMAG_05890 [Clostridium magnum DSM 2767]SHI61330.1 hypothetical protein SAMN02745944_04587 [Clostridium magnum DSM 2767]
MSKRDESIVKMRDLFRETADIIDEMLELETKEAAGQDVSKEAESVAGRFMFKMMEISSLGD